MKLRTRWFIYPQFQLKLVLAGLVPFAACLLIFAWLAYSSLDQMGAAASALSLPPTDRYYDMLYLQKLALTRYLLISGAIGLVTSFVFILVVSHRLAGPIFRLKKHLAESVSSGKFQDIQFRQHDYLKDIESDLNKIGSGKIQSV